MGGPRYSVAGEPRRSLPPPLTVGQRLERWLVTRNAPRASTLRGYPPHVRLYLARYLGQILLADLALKPRPAS